MSDENAPNDSQPGNDGSAPTSTSAVDALLADVRAKSADFDAIISAGKQEIQVQIDLAKAASAEASAIQSGIESSKSAAAQAEERAKESLSAVEALRTDVATIKGAVDAIQQAIATDAASIANSKLEVQKIETAASALAEKLSNDHAAIAGDINALQERRAALQSILEDLAAAKAAAETDSAAAKSSLKEIEDAKAAFAKLNTDTQAQYDTLVQRQTSLQAKITEIEDANTQITNFRRVLLESSDSSKSVQDQIGELHAQINMALAEATTHRDSAVSAFDDFKARYEREGQTWNTALNKKFDTLYETLQEKILSLLPSAGAAGLASTYYDAKSRYAPTSFAGKPGATKAQGPWGHVRRWFGYNPASVVATLFFYAMFLGPLAIIILGSFQLLWKMESDVHFVVDYRMLAVRFLIAVPLATISTFGFASLRLYRRLFEEYNHKQRVMELYQSFVNEVGKNGTDAQKKELLDIMLKSVAHKAWSEAERESGDLKGLDAFSLLDRVIEEATKIKALGGTGAIK